MMEEEVVALVGVSITDPYASSVVASGEEESLYTLSISTDQPFAAVKLGRSATHYAVRTMARGWDEGGGVGAGGGRGGPSGPQRKW